MRRIAAKTAAAVMMILICIGICLCPGTAADETERNQRQETVTGRGKEKASGPGGDRQAVQEGDKGPYETGTSGAEPSETEIFGKDVSGTETSEAEAPGTEVSESENSEREVSGTEAFETEPSEAELSEAEPEWSEEDLRKEPEGLWTVQVTDVHADLPEEGRYYDGTDRIRVRFRTSAYSKTGENPPAYRVLCDARLDSPDAGERKVICSFTLQTPWPEHVGMDPSETEPDITVHVQRAVLEVRVADGTKRYGDPADMEHIDFQEQTVVNVTGFAKDADGNPVIPEGFRPPEAEVDSSILKKDSPIYGADPADPDKWSVLRYRAAVVLKTDREGNLTGNPTDNYEFCTDPEDPRCHLGTVTVISAPVVFGKDYEIGGPEGAFLRGEDGTVYVRRGCCLEVNALKGSGYNKGYTSNALDGDSLIAFRLCRRDSRGRLLADSEEAEIFCRTDGSVPEPVVTVSGASRIGEVYYADSSTSLSYRVPDDDLSGIRSVRIRLRRCADEEGYPPASQSGQEDPGSGWTETGMSGTAQLDQEGIWRLETEVADRVGNTGISLGEPVILDCSAPAIVIHGALNGSANAGPVRLSVSCTDPHYRTGSLQAGMTAAYGGVIPRMLAGEESGKGASLRFADFPVKREADAVYTLRVTASDLAGNAAERTVTFSVNRFGSVYRLSDSTKMALDTYYHQEPFPVTFIETNIDRVTNARILLREGQQLRELASGTTLQVREARTGRKTWRYHYTLPAETFSCDGMYEVMLMSSDAAGNSTDSTAQQLPVRFAVDRTPPECLVSGILPGEIRREKSMTAVVEVRDNLAAAGAQVYVNSLLEEELSEEQIREAGGVFKIPLHAGKEWQTLQIHVTDCAGNEMWTEEIPFLLGPEAGINGERYQNSRLSARQIALIRGMIGKWKKQTYRFLRRADGGEEKVTFRKELKQDSPGDQRRVTGGMLRAERIRGLQIFTLLFAGIAAALLAGRAFTDRQGRRGKRK